MPLIIYTLDVVAKLFRSPGNPDLVPADPFGNKGFGQAPFGTAPFGE